MDAEIDEEFQSLTQTSEIGKVLVRFDIPVIKRKRFLWVGLDAYYRVTAGDFWYIFGEVRFTKFGSRVATIPLSRGNIPNVSSLGPTFTLSPGGVQPGIRFAYGAAEGAAVQWYADLPCTVMDVEADCVELFVKTLRDYSGGGTTAFVAGLRIQSQ